jgi:hypothetical protein
MSLVKADEDRGAPKDSEAVVRGQGEVGGQEWLDIGTHLDADYDGGLDAFLTDNLLDRRYPHGELSDVNSSPHSQRQHRRGRSRDVYGPLFWERRRGRGALGEVLSPDQGPYCPALATASVFPSRNLAGAYDNVPFGFCSVATTRICWRHWRETGMVMV